MQFRARAATAVAAAALLAASSGGGIAFADTDDSGSGSGSGSSGSLSSSGLGLGDAIADLAVAAKALNGPVTVTPKENGGATVTYTNSGSAAEECVGFTAPYSTITENDLDVGFDTSDLAAGLALLKEIEKGPDVTLLLGDENGAPIERADDPDFAEDITFEVVGLQYEYLNPDYPANSVDVAPGTTVSWTTDVPDSPVAAGVICIVSPSSETSELAINFGIDKQVVADQINGKIPGGSVEPVSAGSISGGSVGAGAAVFGSLADGGDEPSITPAE